MPDGHEKIFAPQIIYSNVTRKHSGTYVCEGTNGSGYIATDTIKIDVMRKYQSEGQLCKDFDILVSPRNFIHFCPRMWLKSGSTASLASGTFISN
jgi:hypothetical protein